MKCLEYLPPHPASNDRMSPAMPANAATLLILQGCQQVAAAISGASVATEMMNRMLDSGLSFDEVLEKMQRHGLLPRNANL